MSINRIPFEFLRQDAKNRIESVELWLRRILDKELIDRYGLDYYNSNPEIFNQNIRTEINRLRSANPGRFQREIDALFLDILIDFICNVDRFANFFKKYFASMMPANMAQPHIYFQFCFDRLKDVRNRLAHPNPVDLIEFEFVFSFTSDCTKAFQNYYRMSGQERNYNGPRIIKITDHSGNEYFRRNLDAWEIFDLSGNMDGELRPGDILVLEVEVDPSFTDTTYQFRFGGTDQDYSPNNRLEYQLTNRDVNVRKPIYCQVKADREWHLDGEKDDQVTFYYKVLPPIQG